MDHCQNDDVFHCKNKRCIDWLKRCDELNDCGDNSDETNCDPCPFKRFQCKNKKCIDQDYICNGYDNCGDNSDEEDCVFEGILCDFEMGMCGWKYVAPSTPADVLQGNVLRCLAYKSNFCIESPMMYYGFEKKCLQFSYRIEEDPGTLEVYTTDNESTSHVFFKVDMDGFEWRSVNTLILKREGHFQIKFLFVTNYRDLDYAYVDNILVTNCSQKEFHQLAPVGQCRKVFGKKSSLMMTTSEIDLHSSPSLICSALPCSVNGKVELIIAAFGTPCGHGKFCQRGNCTSNSTHSNISDYCFHGNDRSFRYLGFKCKDILPDRENLCYMMTFRTNCCKTCRKVYLELLHGLVRSKSWPRLKENYNQEDYITPVDIVYNQEDCITPVDILYNQEDCITPVDIVYNQEDYITPVDIVYNQEDYITPVDILYNQEDYINPADDFVDKCYGK
ncbi:hypothetical protein Btru_043162 [Bulinus truncatus]|nr:hypothetical protein Btru_043162 [Bulinus truncatus]